jgi:hypothetical protein
MAGLVWGHFCQGGGGLFSCCAALGMGGALPPFDFSGSARCRWPNPRQGRSRRRRWPKASLYEGLAIDDNGLPRSGADAACGCEPRFRSAWRVQVREADGFSRGPHGRGSPFAAGGNRRGARLPRSGGATAPGPWARPALPAGGCGSFGRGSSLRRSWVLPRRPFVEFRPWACMLVSGGVLEAPAIMPHPRSATGRDRGGRDQSWRRRLSAIARRGDPPTSEDVQVRFGFSPLA